MAYFAYKAGKAKEIFVKSLKGENSAASVCRDHIFCFPPVSLSTHSYVSVGIQSTDRVWVMALPFINWVTLDKLFNLS